MLEQRYEAYPSKLALLNQQVKNAQFGVLEILKEGSNSFSYSNDVKKSGSCEGMDGNIQAPCGSNTVSDQKLGFLAAFYCNTQNPQDLNLCNQAISTLMVTK